MHPLIALACALAALSSPVAHADSLSAGATDEALHQGALAWDVRNTPSVGLPGALRVEPALLDAWLSHHDLSALQTAVSRAGIDLSRDVVIYGEAGDARAQALVASLQTLSPGRVHWLVGGATEWAMTGRGLAPFSAHLPVPQQLVLASAGNGHMASASLRGVAPEQVLALR
ncbi:MAG TPA: rhodanese-like domain-containing protein [Burkholderiaceae bacterium]|jgi:3-mercaptopyruvate sulfurtransferase SseA